MFVSISAGCEVSVPHVEVPDVLFAYPRAPKVLAKDAAVPWRATIRPDVQFLVQHVVLRDPRPKVAVPVRSHAHNALGARVSIVFTRFEKQVDPVAGEVATVEGVCDTW